MTSKKILTYAASFFACFRCLQQNGHGFALLRVLLYAQNNPVPLFQINPFIPSLAWCLSFSLLLVLELSRPRPLEPLSDILILFHFNFK